MFSNVKLVERFLGDGALTVLTTAQGSLDPVKETSETTEPILLKTVLQLDGDVLTWACPSVFEHPQLLSQHQACTQNMITQVKNLRKSLDWAVYLGGVPIAIHTVSAFIGDWKEDLWSFLPFSLMGLASMVLRPLVISYAKRKFMG